MSRCKASAVQAVKTSNVLLSGHLQTLCNALGFRRGWFDKGCNSYR
jgi:hypothetical protein